MKREARLFTLGCLLLLAVLASPFRVVRVYGKSMEPTLHHGETYLLDLFYYRVTDLRRDDIVVISHGGEQLVKRLIGLPGDQLLEEYARDGWIVSIHNLTVRPRPRLTLAPNQRIFTVPPGHVFVIGDNMNGSEDSRRLGPIPRDHVLGVVRTFTLNRHFRWPYPVDPVTRQP